MNITAMADRAKKSRRRRKNWSRFVRAVAMVVVFCTTYALILPAITMEAEVICGYSAHLHSEACYQSVEPTKCSLTEAEGHSHSADCYAQEKTLVCTLAEGQAHAHNDECNGTALICGQEAVEAHAHDESCYKEVSELSCAVEHEHTDACYESAMNIVCGKTATEGHAHAESCYETKTCTLEETEGHTHGETCYEVKEVKTCILEESEGHSHANDVTEPTLVLSCGLTEHEHTQECYPEEFTEPEEPDFVGEDDDLTVYVEVYLPDDTTVPEEAVLQVTPIAEGSESYTKMVQMAEDTVEGTVNKIALYDISFTTADGGHIEVDDTARVSIRFLEDVVDPEANLVVLHYDDNDANPVPLDNVTVEEQEAVSQVATYSLRSTEPEPTESANTNTVVEFETDGFSTFAIVELDDVVDGTSVVASIVPAASINELDGMTLMISSELQTANPDYPVPANALVRTAMNTLEDKPVEQGVTTVTVKTNTLDKMLWVFDKVEGADNTYTIQAKDTDLYLNIADGNLSLSNEERNVYVGRDDNNDIFLYDEVTYGGAGGNVRLWYDVANEVFAANTDTNGYWYADHIILSNPLVETTKIAREDAVATDGAEDKFPLNGRVFAISTYGQINGEQWGLVTATSDTGYRMQRRAVTQEADTVYVLKDMLWYFEAVGGNAANTYYVRPYSVTDGKQAGCLQIAGGGLTLADSEIGENGQILAGCQLQVSTDAVAGNQLVSPNGVSLANGRYVAADGDATYATAPQFDVFTSYEKPTADGNVYRGDLILSEYEVVVPEEAELVTGLGGSEYVIAAVNFNEVPAEGSDGTIVTPDSNNDDAYAMTNKETTTKVGEDQMLKSALESSENPIDLQTTGTYSPSNLNRIWKFEDAVDENGDTIPGNYYISCQGQYLTITPSGLVVGGSKQAIEVVRGTNTANYPYPYDDVYCLRVPYGDTYSYVNVAGNYAGNDFSSWGGSAYVDEDLLQNGDFSDGYNHWEKGFGFNEPKTGWGDFATIDASSNQAKIEIYKKPINWNKEKNKEEYDEWNVQLLQSLQNVNTDELTGQAFSLKPGYTYEISFEAKSTWDRTIKLDVMNRDDNFVWYGGGTVALTGEMTQYTIKFKVDSKYGEDDKAALYIGMGTGSNGVAWEDFEAHTITFDNFSMKQVDSDKYDDSSPDDAGNHLLLLKEEPRNEGYTATVLTRQQLRGVAMMPGVQLVVFVRQTVDGVDHYYAVKADGSAQEITLQEGQTLAAGSTMIIPTEDPTVRWEGSGIITAGWGITNDPEEWIDLQLKNVSTGEYLVPHILAADNTWTDNNDANGDAPATATEYRGGTAHFTNDGILRGIHNPGFHYVDNLAEGSTIDTNIASLIFTALREGTSNDDTHKYGLWYSSKRNKFEVLNGWWESDTQRYNNNTGNIRTNDDLAFYVAAINLDEEFYEPESETLVGQILTREEFQSAAQYYGEDYPFIILAKDAKNNIYAMDAYGDAQQVYLLEGDDFEAGGRIVYVPADDYNSNRILWDASMIGNGSYGGTLDAAQAGQPGYLLNNYGNGWVDLVMRNVASKQFLSPALEAGGELTADLPVLPDPADDSHGLGFYFVDDGNFDDTQAKIDQTIASYLSNSVSKRDKKYRLHLVASSEDGTVKFEIADEEDGLTGYDCTTLDAIYVAMLVDWDVTVSAAEDENDGYERKSVAEYKPIPSVNENVKMYVFNYGAAVDLYGQYYNGTDIVDEKKPGVNVVVNADTGETTSYLDYGNDLAYRFFYRPVFGGEAIDGTNDPNNGGNLYSQESDPFDNGTNRLFARTLIDGFPAMEMTNVTNDGKNVSFTYDTGETTAVTTEYHNGKYYSLAYLFDPLGFVPNKTTGTEEDKPTNYQPDYASLVISDSSVNGDLHAIDGNNGTEVNATNGKTDPADKDDSAANNPNYAVRSYSVGDGFTTGLFQRDENGFYYYDSKSNAATYNVEKGVFELYDYSIFPGDADNRAGGNFLPFNNGYQARRVADETLVSSGGAPILDTISKNDRMYQMNGFEQNDNTTTGRESMTDMWIGMYMEINFTMTEDGMVAVSQTRDTDDGLKELKKYTDKATGAEYWYDEATWVVYDSNGYPTDIQVNTLEPVREPLIFHFAGDDDVLVYIDDMLAMDLNGIHGVWDGYIDFSTGRVETSEWYGSDKGYYAQDTSLKTLIDASGLDIKTGSGDLANTLKPNTNHTLKFYYLERGGNISDCAISFNLEMLPQGGLTITKEVQGLDKFNNVYGPNNEVYNYDGEYTFQLVDIIQPYDAKLHLENPASDGVVHNVPYTIRNPYLNTSEQGTLHLEERVVTMNYPVYQTDANGNIIDADVNDIDPETPSWQGEGQYEVCRYYPAGVGKGVTFNPETHGNAVEKQMDLIDSEYGPYYVIYRYQSDDNSAAVFFYMKKDQEDKLFKAYEISGDYDPFANEHFYRVFDSETFTLENHETIDMSRFIVGTLVCVKEYPTTNGVELGLSYWWEVTSISDNNTIGTGRQESDEEEDGSQISQPFDIENTTVVNIICRNNLQTVNLGIRKVLYDEDGTTISDDLTTPFSITYRLSYPTSQQNVNPFIREEDWEDGSNVYLYDTILKAETNDDPTEGETETNNRVVAQINHLGVNDYDIQLKSPGSIHLEEGKTYKMSFTASSSVARKVSFNLMSSDGNYYWYGKFFDENWEDPTLTPNEQTFEYTFVANFDSRDREGGDEANFDTTAQLYVSMGRLNEGDPDLVRHTIILDNFSLREVKEGDSLGDELITDGDFEKGGIGWERVVIANDYDNSLTVAPEYDVDSEFDQGDMLRTHKWNTWELRNQGIYGTIVDTRTKEEATDDKGNIIEPYNGLKFVTKQEKDELVYEYEDVTITVNPENSEYFMWTANIPFGSTVQIIEIRDADGNPITLAEDGYAVSWSFEGWDKTGTLYAADNGDQVVDTDVIKVTISEGEGAGTYSFDENEALQYTVNGKTVNIDQSTLIDAGYDTDDYYSKYGCIYADSGTGSTTKWIGLLATDNFITIYNTPQPEITVEKAVIGSDDADKEQKFDFNYYVVEPGETIPAELPETPSGTLTDVGNGESESVHIPRGSSLMIHEPDADKFATSYEVYSHYEDTRTFTVEDATAGEYTLRLNCNEAVTQDPDFVLTINGVWIQNPVWTQNGNSIQTTVSLNAGENTITLTGDDVDLVNSVANDELTVSETAMKTKTFTVTPPGEKSETAALYTLRLFCNNVSTEAVNYTVSVNDGPAENATWKKTTYSGMTFFETTVSLKPGVDNEIVIGEATAAEGAESSKISNLDYIEILWAANQGKTIEIGNIYDPIRFHYTNDGGFELPHTGGAGTMSYTMAGLVLILCSAAYLVYRKKREGRVE